MLVDHPTSPSLQCLNCGEKFCGGATRIRDHITGMGNIKACQCETDAFLALKQKKVEEATDKSEKKKQKTAEHEVDEASEKKPPVVKEEVKFSQMSMKSSMNAATAADVDDVISEFFFGCNISPSIVDHPRFKKTL